MRRKFTWIWILILLLFNGVLLMLLLRPAGKPTPTDGPAQTGQPQLPELAQPEQTATEPAQPATTQAEPTEQSRETETAAPVTEAPPSGERLCVTSPRFHCLSHTQIRIFWPDDLDAEAEAYRIMRKTLAGADDWELRGTVESDGSVDAAENAWTDRLETESPRQYLYRVDLVLPQDSPDAALEGIALPAGNRSVCLDPGHYRDSSRPHGEQSYDYTEGQFTLRIGLALRTELLTRYGIDVIMTRETEDITLGGYTNGELDSSYITLRGKFAEGRDLFVSLHTNANLDDANGYPTYNQPLGINKTLILVNQIAAHSVDAIAAANAIGEKVTAVNRSLGLGCDSGFLPGSPERLVEWSDEYNDGLDLPGAVCYRLGSSGDDYYGVLRGSASIGVPGMIVGHGHHSVAEVRREAMEGDLAQQWAQADAAGIAQSFGFQPAF